MVDVKPIDQVVSKWSTRAGAASTDYTNGAIAKASKWQSEAAASGPNWAAGVQDAVANNRFANGINKSGSAAYSSGVQSKGSARYAGGITAGKNNYQSGMGPVLSALQSVTLPPRGPRGSPQNLQRVAAIDTALRSLRTGQ